MKALPIQKRALLKRMALIDAGIVEFAAVGFEASTAKTIASRAGVATGTFYQYFENKSEVLRVIAAQRIDELQSRLNWDSLQTVDAAQSIEQTFKQNLEFTYEFHSTAPKLHQILEQRRDLDEQLEAIMNKGDLVLYERTLQLVKSFNVDYPDVVAQNLFAMAEGIVHRHVFHQNELNTGEVLSVGAKMLAHFFSHS